MAPAPAPGAALPPPLDPVQHPPLRRGAWRRVPAPVRRLLVAVAGAGLVLLGGVLLVLPGPFTLPPVLAGLALLSSEFPWAERLRARVTARWQAVWRTPGRTSPGGTRGRWQQWR